MNLAPKVYANRFFSGLLPVPYIGNVKNAKYYFLLLNPGVEPCDFFVECANHLDYKKETLNNLFQEDMDDKYPFFLLNPKFSWTGGGRYWRKKFNKGIDDFYKSNPQKKDVLREDIISHISKQICAIQYIPYHSVAYKHHESHSDLPSVERVKKFIKEIELDSSRTKTICVLRSKDKWGLTASESIKINEGAHSRSAYIEKDIIEKLIKSIWGESEL